MKILAIDYGDARTGLATCDKSEFLASPAGVISEWNTDKLIEKLVAAVKEHRAERIVLGYPKNMDGTVGERAQKCEKLAEVLKEKTGLDVRLWDERRTTVAAHDILNVTDVRGKKRKQVVDAVAAVLILEGYMAYRKSNPDKI